MNKKRLLSACTALAVAAALLGLPLSALADEVVAPPLEADVKTAAPEKESDQEPVAEPEEPEPLSITFQSGDVNVKYPSGAVFYVEVSDPEQVASYQWIANDGSSDHILTGITATTDELHIPGTMQNAPDMSYRCIITDVDGNTIESRPATLHVSNSDVDRTVLYIGDRWLMPGFSIDLSTTTLGTGKITLSTDGTTLTFDNVFMSTEVMTGDAATAPTWGILLVNRNSEVQEFHVKLVGENIIENAFVDPEGNASGTVLSLPFGVEGAEDPPTVTFEGAGTLTLRGGDCGFSTDANLIYQHPLSIEPAGSTSFDGIACHDLLIPSGVHLELRTNGTALRTSGDLRIEPGATVSVQSVPASNQSGPARKSIVDVGGSISITDAALNVNGTADPTRFVPFGSTLGSFTGISYGGDLTVENSSISVVMTMRDSDNPYLQDCCGIDGNGPASSMDMLGVSTLSVRIECGAASFAKGISVADSLNVDVDCEITASVLSAGETVGIESGGTFSMTDATVDSRVRSTTDGIITYGIVCGEFEITCSRTGYSLRSVAETGIALAARTDDRASAFVEPVAGYVPKLILIANPAVVLTPATGEVNALAFPLDDGMVKGEAVYYPNDRSFPASEVEIGIPDPGGDVVMVGIVSSAAIIAVARLATRKSRRVRSLYEEFRYRG